jgi:orotate phosphoribosyltransferase
LGNQIEGEYHSWQKTVVIEDLVSTGKSSLQVVEVLRQSGLDIIGMASIFNYGFDVAVEAFEKAEVPLHSLTNYTDLVALAQQKQQITEAEQEILLKWRQDPANWKGIS